MWEEYGLGDVLWLHVTELCPYKTISQDGTRAKEKTKFCNRFLGDYLAHKSAIINALCKSRQQEHKFFPKMISHLHIMVC